MQKSTLNLVITDTDLVQYNLSARDRTSLNHPKLVSLSHDIIQALKKETAKL